jgi:hypothetical protein
MLLDFNFNKDTKKREMFANKKPAAQAAGFFYGLPRLRFKWY